MILTKKPVFTSLLAIAMLAMFAGSLSAQNLNPNYDAELAEEMGADDYGMKSYILVILKTGNRDAEIKDKAVRDSLFAGHLSNIQRLAELEKLIVAGPLTQNENSYRGIFILNTDSMEEAQELLQTDPAVKENILEAELYGWYGSAALPVYLEAADKVGKYSIN
ncbi:MAG: YciI family protein [Balneolaceae bacterium]